MNKSRASSRITDRRSVTFFPFKPVVAAMVAVMLSGCSPLTGPDRLEIPQNTNDFRGRLYTGASIGTSRLTPDTRGTVFNVDSDSDAGTQLRLGYDVHNMLAVELDTSVLGAAELQESNTDVKYSSAAISALVYGLSGVQMRSRREGLSAFARLGYGTLKKSSAVIDLEESGAVPILGLGAEYGFSNGLGFRAEITRFDSDASYVGFGAIYRFGISPAGISQMIAQAAEPALGAAHTTVGEGGRILSRTTSPRYNPSASYGGVRDVRTSNPHANKTSNGSGTVADRWRPAMRAGDRDNDGVMDTTDDCADTGASVTVDRYGCGLFDAVLEDVTFKSGSQWLSPRARGQLDSVAETLLAFPESRVQVRAHTDSKGAADMNLGLSARRAEAVVQYLQSRGVNELQLQAVGIGEAQPLDSNSDDGGRRRNRRVDLVTLPDLDAGQLLVASTVGSARVVSVSDASQIQPDRDSYRHSVAEAGKLWNSRQRPAMAVVQKATDAQNHVEPGLQAANPVEDAPVATESARPAIAPLPMPGIVPGLNLTGVVQGLSFPLGASTLTVEAKQALEPVVAALQEHSDASIVVMAHTDDMGDAETNLALSKQRAVVVVQHLINSGINEARLKSEGYGELLPLVQNLTAEDRARNRRVEIRVLP